MAPAQQHTTPPQRLDAPRQRHHSTRLQRSSTQTHLNVLTLRDSAITHSAPAPRTPSAGSPRHLMMCFSTCVWNTAAAGLDPWNWRRAQACPRHTATAGFPNSGVCSGTPKAHSRCRLPKLGGAHKRTSNLTAAVVFAKPGLRFSTPEAHGLCAPRGWTHTHTHTRGGCRAYAPAARGALSTRPRPSACKHPWPYIQRTAHVHAGTRDPTSNALPKCTQAPVTLHPTHCPSARRHPWPYIQRTARVHAGTRDPASNALPALPMLAGVLGRGVSGRHATMHLGRCHMRPCTLGGAICDHAPREVPYVTVHHKTLRPSWPKHVQGPRRR